MKIVIIHPKASIRNSLIEWLEKKRGHAVLAHGNWPADLRAAVAEFEPNLVLLPPAPATKDAALPSDIFVPLTFPECPFETLPDGPLFSDEKPSAKLEGFLDEQERIYRERPWSVRDYADDQRIIVHDQRYQPLASVKKLHLPKDEPGYLYCDQCRIVLHLQMAQTDDRHQRAQDYCHALERFSEGLMQETAYRLSHGSYKIVWLREQIARWLTVLAHYIPDFEIENGPAPHTASPRVDFVHYEMPPVYHYAVYSVLACRINKSVAEQIRTAMLWQFTGQSEAELVYEGCFLFGLNAYLEQVARAQIVAMSQFLDPESEFHRQGTNSRNLRRTLGIYFVFWGWDHLRNMMDAGLQEITRKFHSGEIRVKLPEDVLTTPTFRLFRQLFLVKKPSVF